MRGAQENFYKEEVGRLRCGMNNTDKIKQLRCLLIEALAWLDDYGMRMSGSAGLADKIKEALDDDNED